MLLAVCLSLTSCSIQVLGELSAETLRITTLEKGLKAPVESLLQAFSQINTTIHSEWQRVDHPVFA
jgi:hypothetical protein